MWRHRKAIDRLEDRLKRTEDLCAAMEREHKKLDMEFTDLYDKVKRQMSRMAKRYALDTKESEDLTPATIDGSPTDGLDPISRGILARRGSRVAK